MKIARSLTALSAAIVILGAAACGGGGGGYGGGTAPPPPPTSSVTGNGLAPATGPGDTSQYFPAAQGDKWSFNYVTDYPSALSPTGIVDLSVNGTKTIQGVTATVFTRADPTAASGGYDQYFYVNGGGVTLLGNSDPSDSLTPLIVPYVELLFPVQVGPVSSLTGTKLPFGKDPSGNAVTLNLTQSIANVAVESVDVPAGSFSSAMRQTTSISATAFDSGQSAPTVSAADTIWIVPGIGQVKDQSSASGNGTSISSSSELRGYTINGVPHGLGVPADLIPGLVGTSCLGPGYIAPPSSATDHTNYLIVAHNCDASSGSVQLKWVATLVGPDGTVRHSADLSAVFTPPAQVMIGLHAVVAFDGTNYLVVHEDDNNPVSSGGANLDALLVSPSGTIVAGPNVAGAAYFNSGLPGDPEALAFDGSRYLLVYVDNNAVVRPPQLSGLFISPATGQPDGVPFTISQSNDYNHAEPAVGFDGTNYLVVWVENGSNPPGLSAVRISKTGTVLDAQPLLIMNSSGAGTNSSGICCDLEPAVSFDGANYLVAYKDTRGAAAYSDTGKISAARVSTAGVLLDGSASTPGIAVTTVTGVHIGRVRSAFFGGTHWLVWDAGSPDSLTASRVSPSGKAPSVWPNGFPLVPAAAAQGSEQWPALSATANAGLVTWTRLQPSPSTATALRAIPIFSPGP
jgi:hypothetical protein